FDQCHRFNLAGALKLPHGFAFGLITSVHSGIPYNITTGFDNNHDTVANDRPSPANPNAPFTSLAIDGSSIGKIPGVLYDGASMASTSSTASTPGTLLALSVHRCSVSPTPLFRHGNSKHQ